MAATRLTRVSALTGVWWIFPVGGAIHGVYRETRANQATATHWSLHRAAMLGATAPFGLLMLLPCEFAIGVGYAIGTLVNRVAPVAPPPQPLVGPFDGDV